MDLSARAYLGRFFGIALAGFALLALLGLVVDGYGVFGTRLIPASRFPADLRLLKHGDRVTKAIEIAERRGDRILFVGDSRTQHGLDPDAPALGGVQGYNAALAAATLSEQLVALDYALAHEPGIKRVIWGLSFEAFPFPTPTSSDYGDSAFAGNSIVSGLMRHLFAYDRVVSSWKALLQARHKVRAPMKRNGVVTYAGDPVEGPQIAKMFEVELVQTYQNISGPVWPEAIDKAHVQLEKRLTELKAAGIDVDLVIVPVHILRLEFFRLIGVEEQDEAWKRRVATTVATLAKAPGSGKVRFHDFARPHPFTEQSVNAPPPPGERRYYLETSHFYPWLGDKVLAKVFGKADEVQDPTFGVEIGPVPIESDLASARAGLDAWEAAHPDEVGYVKKLLSKK